MPGIFVNEEIGGSQGSWGGRRTGRRRTGEELFCDSGITPKHASSPSCGGNHLLQVPLSEDGRKFGISAGEIATELSHAIGSLGMTFCKARCWEVLGLHARVPRTGGGRVWFAP